LYSASAFSANQRLRKPSLRHTHKHIQSKRERENEREIQRVDRKREHRRHRDTPQRGHTLTEREREREGRKRATPFGLGLLQFDPFLVGDLHALHARRRVRDEVKVRSEEEDRLQVPLLHRVFHVILHTARIEYHRPERGWWKIEAEMNGPIGRLLMFTLTHKEKEKKKKKQETLREENANKHLYRRRWYSGELVQGP
jgi:hypothetical protein